MSRRRPSDPAGVAHRGWRRGDGGDPGSRASRGRRAAHWGL